MCSPKGQFPAALGLDSSLPSGPISFCPLSITEDRHFAPSFPLPCLQCSRDKQTRCHVDMGCIAEFVPVRGMQDASTFPGGPKIPKPGLGNAQCVVRREDIAQTVLYPRGFQNLDDPFRKPQLEETWSSGLLEAGMGSLAEALSTCSAPSGQAGEGQPSSMWSRLDNSSYFCFSSTL